VRLTLVSASERRRQLLATVGIVPDRIAPADIDESVRAGERPQHYAVRMAREKVLACHAGSGEIRLAADTVVVCGRRILGKPAHASEAEIFLRRLAGRRHKVITAVSVSTSTATWMRSVASRVKFRRLTNEEITAYIQSNEWQGKAGGYAIQGGAAEFVPWINGSYTAIVGLPLAESVALLRAAGWT